MSEEETTWGDVWDDDWEFTAYGLSAQVECACGRDVYIPDGDEIVACECGRRYRILATVQGRGRVIDGFFEVEP